MYRVAIVGGETHIEEVTQLREKLVKIVGAAVRAEQTQWAEKTFAAPVYTDFRQLLDEIPCDIVAVANENDLRPAVILEALRRGKHVIVDKPMALTVEDVDEIEAAASAGNRRVLMILPFRGNPWYVGARNLVRSGEIGEPVQVYGKMQVPLKANERPPWFLDIRRSGGPILDLAIHTFDMVEWVTGLKITSVYAREANISHPEMQHLIDSGTEFFTLNNGGVAVVEQNRVGFDYDYRLYIVGTHGQINLHYRRDLRIQTADGWREQKLEDLPAQISIVENWLNSVDGGKSLLPDSDTFRISRLTALTKRAAETKKPIAIPF
jgi:predicted dehydrogenase